MKLSSIAAALSLQNYLGLVSGPFMDLILVRGESSCCLWSYFREEVKIYFNILFNYIQLIKHLK